MLSLIPLKGRGYNQRSLSRQVGLEQKNLLSWATVLNEARRNGKPVAQISQLDPKIPGFTRDAAYGIQEAQMETRFQDGEKQLGWKMGLTSEAKRRQMNLDSPLYGFLTDRMKVENGGVFTLKGSIHPKIEPEVAFWIKKDLGENPTRDEVLAATGAICACMEILDSRYEQFKYFSMEDVISDNSSSSHFVLGPWKEDFRGLDLKNLKMEMSVDGQVSQKGISSDISGDPVVSVIELCQLLAKRGRRLKADSVVLAGAATPAVELKSGMTISLTVDGLAPLSVKVSQ